MVIGFLILLLAQPLWAANPCAEALEELQRLRTAAEDATVSEGERMERLAALHEYLETLRRQGVDTSALLGTPRAGRGALEGPGVPTSTPHTAVDALPFADARDLRGLLYREVLATSQGEELLRAVARGKHASYRFVKILPGTYTMGSPEGEVGRRENENQRVVTIAEAFELQATPVTVGQIMAWLRITGGKDRDRRPRFQDFRDRDAFAEFFQAEEADAFAAWLNTLPGVKASGCHYFVPSEEQWEWAIRSSVGTPARYQAPRPFSDRDLDTYAFHRSNGNDLPTVVALKAPLLNGLYDMLGSFWQWTSSPGENGRGRIARGGSGFTPRENLRSAYRKTYFGTNHFIDLSLRLARRCP